MIAAQLGPWAARTRSSRSATPGRSQANCTTFLGHGKDRHTGSIRSHTACLCFILCRGVGGALGSWAKQRVAARTNRNCVLPIKQGTNDSRLAIYKASEASGKESLEYQRALQEEALKNAGAPSGTPCCVDVHYSWVCLERLQQALERGHCITVGSVLLPEAVSLEQLELSKKCSSLVFQAKSNLIDAGFAIKGSRKNFCRFVVAYPVSLDVSDMKAPFIVIDNISSSHCLGQVLRTAYHFGIDSVILSGTAWKHIDSRAMRVSVGWGYHMSFHLASSVANALRSLQSRGTKLFAMCEDPSAETIRTVKSLKLTSSWALLLGCHSLSGELELSRVRIPCALSSGMLDAAHAAAICLYELSGLSSRQTTSNDL